MSPRTRAARAGWNLLVALLVGAAIIVAIVAAYIAGRGSAPPAPSTAAASRDPSASASASVADAAPTGCLGGAVRNNAMLLSAQREAPHTAYGAVDFATAFFRWAYRYPYPTAAQANEVSVATVSRRAAPGFKDIARGYSDGTDLTGGQVPAGTPYYLSTTSGVWLINSGSSANEVTVEISAPYVENDAVSATKSAAISATVVWEAGGWRLLREQAPNVTALAAGGTRFTAGC